jgi:hypothetical protein
MTALYKRPGDWNKAVVFVTVLGFIALGAVMVNEFTQTVSVPKWGKYAAIGTVAIIMLISLPFIDRKNMPRVGMLMHKCTAGELADMEEYYKMAMRTTYKGEPESQKNFTEYYKSGGVKREAGCK